MKGSSAQKLVRAGPYEILILSVPLTGDFEVPIKGKRFPLMLVDCAESLPAGAMERISEKMVEAGCRYAVCAGNRNPEWETAFDNADLKRNPKCNDDKFVMTTNNGEDSLDDATFDFLFLTSKDVEADSFVVALVGGKGDDVERIERSIAKVRKGDA